MEFTDKTVAPFGPVFLDLTVQTNLTFKTPLVFRLLKELRKHDCLTGIECPREELCFDEAITNAMMHGNKLDPAKKLRIQLFGNRERWGVIIEDEGNGFGPENLPRNDTEAALLRETGRGILVMDGYLAELRYNRQEKRLLLVGPCKGEVPETTPATAGGATPEPPPTATGPLAISEEDGIQILEVCESRIADANVGSIREALIRNSPAGKSVVVDLSRVKYVSSVGMGALVLLYKQVRGRKGQLILVGLQPALRGILETGGLLRLFQVAADRKSGVLELKKMQ